MTRDVYKIMRKITYTHFHEIMIITPSHKTQQFNSEKHAERHFDEMTHFHET